MLDFHVHIARLPMPEAVARELAQTPYKANLVACEPWEWKAALPLAERFPHTFRICLGIHPMIADRVQANDLKELESALLRSPDALVGECGLDRHSPGYAPGGIQERIFRHQARLAKELDRPLMIHAVCDARRILSILEEFGFPGKNSRPIFHRFNGDREIADRAVRLGAIFSLHPDSFRRASTREALCRIPKESIRFETDADSSFAKAMHLAEKSPAEIARALIENLESGAANYELVVGNHARNLG